MNVYFCLEVFVWIEPEINMKQNCYIQIDIFLSVQRAEFWGVIWSVYYVPLNHYLGYQI